MGNDQKKQVSDKESFVLWVIFVAIITWAIMNHPMLIFALVASGGIWYHFKHSSPKSPGRAEVEKEHEEYLEEADSIAAEKKTDSFYSGISESPSIDDKDE